MSIKETPLIRAYWKKVGGTLVEEFLVVNRTNTNSPRYIDAVIIPDGEHIIANQREVDIRGKDIICVQAKARRLNLPLMGQTLFSHFLLQRFEPKSIISVALCTKDDTVLKPLLEQYPNTKVEIIDYFYIKP